jgi:hypothetical protein
VRPGLAFAFKSRLPPGISGVLEEAMTKSSRVAAILAALIVAIGVVFASVLLFGGWKALVGATDPAPMKLPETIKGVDVAWYTDGRLLLPIPEGMERGKEPYGTQLSMEGGYARGSGEVSVVRKTPEHGSQFEIYLFSQEVLDVYTVFDPPIYESYKKDKFEVLDITMHYMIFGKKHDDGYETASMLAFEDASKQYVIKVHFTKDKSYPLTFIKTLLESVRLVEGGEAGDFVEVQ